MEHLNTTECCNHTFTFADLQGRVLTQVQALGTNFKRYGGNAKYFGRAQCPECKKKYLMWLMPKSPNYKVLTISDEQSETVETKRRGRPAGAAQ